MITIVVALAAGVLVQVMAHHLRVPAIAILLLAGIGLGPQGLGVVEPSSLGGGLQPLVGLCVAVILFEGGMTLDLDGFRTAPRVIRRLITIGGLITWLSTTLLVHFALSLSFPASLLAGSLVMVTGPTVVTPLLRRIRVTSRLHHVLHWEAVLIDPVGVFVALLCYEWVVLTAETGTALSAAPLTAFAIRVLVGGAIGVTGGFALAFALRRHWIPGPHVNIATLAGALLLYGLADLALPHTGILAVTIAGLVIGWQRPPQIRELLVFKLEMTELAVAFLFILLAAELRLASFLQLGVGGIVVVGALIVLVRPLVVTVATWNEGMSWRERAFLSWMAPRGIVAASMASLFAFELPRVKVADGAILAPFTFAVIGATVLLQGSTAGWVARALGVKQRLRAGWLLVGANRVGRELGAVLSRAGVPVVLLDRNANDAQQAASRGLTAIAGDAFDESLTDDPRLAEVGAALMVTDNPALNEVLAQRWREHFGADEAHTWTSLSTGHVMSQTGPPASGSLGWPARVEEGLEDGELSFQLVEAGAPISPTAQVLFSVEQGRAIPGANDARGQRVVLAWRPAEVGDLFQRIVVVASARLEDAFPALAAAAHEVRADLEPADIEAALRRQTSSYSVVIGNGVAIPHVMSREVKRSICIVGVLTEAAGAEAVRVVCLLISPAGDHPRHLEALARIAGWASSSERVERLLEITIAEEALAMLNTFATHDP